MPAPHLPDSPAPKPVPASLRSTIRTQLARATIEIGGENRDLGHDRLAGFLHALLQANTQLNLTRDIGLPTTIVRHVIEPLAVWQALKPILQPGALIDVGPGGGAPGLPIAIANPRLPVTLIESRERKAAYLSETATQLGLSELTVRHGRAEAFGRGEGREQFAVAITRALAPGNIAFEILLPLVQIGGVAAIIAGPNSTKWLDAAARTATELGGAQPEVRPVVWPGLERDVRLVLVRKLTPTPERFPRDMRRIKKDPARA